MHSFWLVDDTNYYLTDRTVQEVVFQLCTAASYRPPGWWRMENKIISEMESFGSTATKWYFVHFIYLWTLHQATTDPLHTRENALAWLLRNEILNLILGLTPTQALHSKCGIRFFDYKVMANRLRFC